MGKGERRSAPKERDPFEPEPTVVAAGAQIDEERVESERHFYAGQVAVRAEGAETRIEGLDGARQAAPAGPVWFGWVMVLGPRGGVSRRAIALPQSVVEQYATGAAESPDTRGIVAMRIERDIRHDRFFDRLVRARRDAKGVE